MDCPVVPAGTGVARDGRVLRHHVVATLGVVVVLAGLADHHVVPGLKLARIVEERRFVVAGTDVLTGSELHPVVSTAAERGVCALRRP